MKKPRAITIHNQKGGSGKTTISVNLAGTLAHMGYKTLLIDIDPQCNATSRLGFKPNTRGIIDVIRQVPVTVEAVKPQFERTAAENGLKFDAARLAGLENLYILPANIHAGIEEREFFARTYSNFRDQIVNQLQQLRTATSSDSDLVELTQYLNNTIESLNTISKDNGYRLLSRAMDLVQDEHSFDFVVIDSPPDEDSLLLSNALVYSGYLIIPVDMQTPSSLENLVRVLTLTTKHHKLNPTLAFLGILENRVNDAQVVTVLHEQLLAFKAAAIMKSQIQDYRTVANAQLSDLPLVFVSPNSAANENFTSLALEIVKKTGAPKPTKTHGKKIQS